MISVGESHSLEDARAQSALRWVNVGGRRIFVLRQSGTLADICHDQGRLLANEIAGGILPEILETIKVETDASSRSIDWIIAAVRRRFSDDVFEASPPEFRAAVDALSDGLAEVLGSERFSRRDVRDAMVAMDVGNLVRGFARLMLRPVANEAVAAFEYLSRAVSGFDRPRPDTFEAEMALADREAIGRGVQKMQAPARQIGVGCTAAGAAAALTGDGHALHARSFDGTFFSWNRTPGLFLIDERASRPDWHRYAAVGTAGLFYSGGLSGMNDVGLAASIHQMSTARYDVGAPDEGYAMAPFLQQRILREASSLDEAHAILSEARHFAAWTIVVTDARAGVSARFEISGGTQTVTRTDLGSSFAQSSHFCDPAMAEKHDFFEDLHFTPSFGKWLETRARHDTISNALAEGQASETLGTDWAIALLADHKDAGIGGRTRSFGRTICRANSLMSSIARPDADRTRCADEMWMTTGETAPGPHSRYMGFAIDWEALDITAVADRPCRRVAADDEAFSRSLADYVAAYEVLARPKDARGGYLGRAPRNGEVTLINQKALALVDRAVRRMDEAGRPDYALRYARARLNHAVGMIDAAAQDFVVLQNHIEAHPEDVHDYDRALLFICAAATEFAAARVLTAKTLLDRADSALSRTMEAAFPDLTPIHEDLLGWRRVIEDLRARGERADLPPFNFVTVE